MGESNILLFRDCAADIAARPDGNPVLPVSLASEFSDHKVPRPDFASRVAFRRFKSEIAVLANSGHLVPAYQKVERALDKRQFTLPSHREELVLMSDMLAQLSASGGTLPEFDADDLISNRRNPGLSSGFTARARGDKGIPSRKRSSSYHRTPDNYPRFAPAA